MDLKRGNVVCFLYPAANYRGLQRKRLERRRLLVDRVRDLEQEPLENVTVENDPQLERGRFLVMGWCLDRQAPRSFYLNAMEEIEELEPPTSIRIPLVVDGKIVRIVELPDPRPGFAKHFNELETGSTAIG